MGVKSGPRHADEQVQWTCESDERREHERAAGWCNSYSPASISERRGGNKNNKKETNNAQNLRERSDW